MVYSNRWDRNVKIVIMNGRGPIYVAMVIGKLDNVIKSTRSCFYLDNLINSNYCLMWKIKPCICY